jgi:Fe-Mn family superoxide dismutase
MSYTLPALPYAYGALEPHLDARTMEIHHAKHHQAYINNALAALEGQAELLSLPVEELLRDITRVPEARRQAVINNAGGHANHSLFWRVMAPGAGGAPGGELGAALDAAFGGFEAFKEQFGKTALTRFGSGWAWLVFDSAGRLAITSTPNQDSPLLTGLLPLLGLDVWEHAYYLQYQNRRADYISAWWHVVHWPQVAELYKAGR